MNYLTETLHTILVIDDTNDTLALVINDLDITYHVIRANDKQDVIDILESSNINLIIGNTSKENKYDLCVFIKRNVKFSHIPFIIISKDRSIDAKIEGFNNGADAYVEKPFTNLFLKAQINSLLRIHHHIYEHYSLSSVLQLTHYSTSNINDNFLEKIQDLILKHIDEHDLCVDFLADKMNMSRPTFYRKIKTASKIAPSELINITRLKKATEYLINGDYKIYEIASLVGFNSSSHFTRNFQKQFGIPPKEYITSIQKSIA